MVEMAKHLRRRGLAVVVVAVIDPPDNDATSADATARLAAANPSITFRLLPAPPSPDAGAHPARRALDTLRAWANPVLREFLRSLPDAVDALLLDVAAYFFFPSRASALAALLHLPYYYPEACGNFGSKTRNTPHGACSPATRPRLATTAPTSWRESRAAATSSSPPAMTQLLDCFMSQKGRVSRRCRVCVLCGDWRGATWTRISVRPVLRRPLRSRPPPAL
ncbi:hypothetical protein OsI_14050 [Oryza sativa Indica Group]|uniref:Uncharacterized protein n=2 Tax=Oryza TaxID=4527 RepID=A0A0E0GVH9_ORYNI|nr:hypothetical protein OsI_14050 [Oryza sativa Indica Group]